MYAAYWNLRERPFQNVADPRFAYLSDQHKEGLARLLYLVEEQKLGGSLVGPYGVGKSMVIELLAEKVRGRPNTLYVQLDAPPAGALSLAKQVVARLGHAAPVYDLAGALDVIQNYFSDGNAAPQHLVLTVDEAQMLRETAVYEFLHLLSNLRVRQRDGSSGATAVTLLLVGHQDLIQHLASEPSLSQRLQLFWRLEPLTDQQTIEYVQHRIRAAGGDLWMFDEEAMRTLYAASQGLPRLINNMCDTALLIGCAGRFNRITGEIMQQAVAEVQSPVLSQALPEGAPA
ncbi:MAG: AAA family ATPase [Kiritimatiellaeota bacterium]|nr:AAA family ATPase [Kiritimatiellota bacterium]